jgi:hypothetical protein
LFFIFSENKGSVTADNAAAMKSKYGDIIKKVLTHSAFLYSVIAAFYLSCNSVEPPPAENNIINNTIVLTSEWQELNTIAVNWNRAEEDTLLTFTYRLKRQNPSGNEFTRDFILTTDDTIYTDNNDGNGLTEGTAYSYRIEAIKNSEIKDTSNTVTVKTLSPTSHNITWQIDTLGQPGELLSDVWGIDENNVWAIGGVHLDGDVSGVIKWDGVKWNLFQSFAGIKRGIFGFTESQIFVVGEYSNRGVVGHFNGTSWTEYRTEYFLANGDTVYPLYSVWGSSPDDVWAVGDKGTIIHWDGYQWRKVQRPTNLILYDVWGTSATNVYALHISFNKQSQLFHYDGHGWTEISDQLPVNERSLTSLWIDLGGTGYLVGNYVVYYDGGTFNAIDINQDRPLRKVRGRNSADVFAVGLDSRVYHFNGIDWTTYPELFDNPPLTELRGVYVTKTTVFAVGLKQNGAIIYRGVRQ